MAAPRKNPWAQYSEELQHEELQDPRRSYQEKLKMMDDLGVDRTDQLYQQLESEHVESQSHKRLARTKAENQNPNAMMDQNRRREPPQMQSQDLRKTPGMMGGASRTLSHAGQARVPAQMQSQDPRNNPSMMGGASRTPSHAAGQSRAQMQSQDPRNNPSMMGGSSQTPSHAGQARGPAQTQYQAPQHTSNMMGGASRPPSRPASHAAATQFAPYVQSQAPPRFQTSMGAASQQQEFQPRAAPAKLPPHMQSKPLRQTSNMMDLDSPPRPSYATSLAAPTNQSSTASNNASRGQTSQFPQVGNGLKGMAGSQWAPGGALFLEAEREEQREREERGRGYGRGGRGRGRGNGRGRGW